MRASRPGGLRVPGQPRHQHERGGPGDAQPIVRLYLEAPGRKGSKTRPVPRSPSYVAAPLLIGIRTTS